MRPRLPLAINIAFIAAGALAVGAKAVDYTGPAPLEQAGSVTTITRTGVETRVVRRVLRGHVVTVHDKVYVQVPVVVIRTDHHTIRIPAHKLRLRSASATVADPMVTVYIPVPDTVYTPTTVTTTVEVPGVPSTITDTITTTVSVPLIPTTSDREEPQ